MHLYLPQHRISCRCCPSFHCLLICFIFLVVNNNRTVALFVSKPLIRQRRFSPALKMSSPVTLKNLIGGQFVDPSVSSYVDVISPATGEKIAQVPLCGRAEVDAAVQAGLAAFPAWSGLTIKQRAAIMLKFHALCNEHADELAQIIIKENGKNIVEALADVAKGNETTEWACSLPQLAQGKTLMVSGGITCRDERVPLGVVGAIVPFNFPAMVPMWTIPIALTMGNCVILKPSEKVPMTMARMAELMIQAGVPPGVFQIVQGAVDVVTAICEHKDISAVTFVGSSKVAEIVSTACHNMNKRVLALGGAKNHLVALPDCDVGMAARDIVASFAGCCGQRCMAASVLIIVDTETSDADMSSHPVLQEVVGLASKLQPGQGAGEVGPLIDTIAKSRVTSYIEESAAGGAQILLDGRHWSTQRPKGNWVGPTIILHKNRADRALHDEIFGPILSVLRVRSFEEAIEIENANPYGNAACVYTERGGNAEWFIKRFRAAMLGVNIGIPVPREPFSFGGLYGTKSKYGDCDITGDGAMEFFSNRIKITSKWSSNYSSGTSVMRSASSTSFSSSTDKANFDGRM